MNLRKWRLQAEMTQQQLANRAKVARASIAHLENGYYPPSASLAGKITAVLNEELGGSLQPLDVFESLRPDRRRRMGIVDGGKA